MTKKIKVIKTKLPNKLSDLIIVAVRDLEKAENTPNVKINMDVWYDVYATDKNKCSVCFAGSVMMDKIPPKKLGDADAFQFFPVKEQKKFYALNKARTGNILGALDELTVGKFGTEVKEINGFGYTFWMKRERIKEMFAPFVPFLGQREVTNGEYRDTHGYKKDKQKFKTVMLDIAGILAAEGL